MGYELTISLIDKNSEEIIHFVDLELNKEDAQKCINKINKILKKIYKKRGNYYVW